MTPNNKLIENKSKLNFKCPLVNNYVRMLPFNLVSEQLVSFQYLSVFKIVEFCHFFLCRCCWGEGSTNSPGEGIGGRIKYLGEERGMINSK